MDTIWKFQFKEGDDVELEMPVGAEILSVGYQGTTACLWARVDPQAPRETRRFRLAGTGHPLGDARLRFLGHLRHPHGLEFFLFEHTDPQEEG